MIIISKILAVAILLSWIFVAIKAYSLGEVELWSVEKELLCVFIMSNINIRMIQGDFNIYFDAGTTLVILFCWIYSLTIGRKNKYKKSKERSAVSFLVSEGVDIEEFTNMSRKEQILFLVRNEYIDDENDTMDYEVILRKN